MRHTAAALFTCVACVASNAGISADAVLFGAVAVRPTQSVWGGALGMSNIPLLSPPDKFNIGVEWEWASFGGDHEAGRIHAHSWNIPIQFGAYNNAIYGTAGLTRWSEPAATGVSEGAGFNVGGGSKIEMSQYRLKMLMVRFDYRYFSLSGRKAQGGGHRAYVGFGLGF
jgi:hypothetical protein